MTTTLKEAELYENSNTLTIREAVEVLMEYKTKIDWKRNDMRVIDIGCGGGGVTVKVLRPYLNNNFKRLLGIDISEDMIEYANKHHGDHKTRFSVLDIQGPLPDQLVGKFDFVFSCYALHWAQQQENVFKNIYNLLDKQGDCLLIFVAQIPLYDIYRIMAKDSKWSEYLSNAEKYITPYQDSKEPANEVQTLMERMGFKDIEVQCREKEYVYDYLETFKNIMMAICPFNIPSELREEYINDYVENFNKVSNIYLKQDKEKVSVIMKYSLIIAYGKK